MKDGLIRRGTRADIDAIQSLYAEVARTSGGLARQADEINRDYVQDFVERSLLDGVCFVAEREGLSGLAGELHAYRNGLRNFSHVLGSLTIAVHPQAQGGGLGRRLFVALLDEVRLSRAEISRFELIAQESNRRAIALYESLGFRREGRFEGDVRSPGVGVEADIPMAWLRGVPR